METENKEIDINNILLKLSKLEIKYTEMKKEMKEIKERFAKLEKTKVIF